MGSTRRYQTNPGGRAGVARETVKNRTRSEISQRGVVSGSMISLRVRLSVGDLDMQLNFNFHKRAAQSHDSRFSLHSAGATASLLIIDAHSAVSSAIAAPPDWPSPNPSTVAVGPQTDVPGHSSPRAAARFTAIDVRPSMACLHVIA